MVPRGEGPDQRFDWRTWDISQLRHFPRRRSHFYRPSSVDPVFPQNLGFLRP